MPQREQLVVPRSRDGRALLPWIGIFAEVFLVCGMLPSAAPAEDLTNQSAALQVITKAADDICYTIPQEGSRSETRLSGEARSDLNTAISKLVGLGFKGAAVYENEEHNGVLQSELAATLRTSIDCKKNVFDTLERKMLGPLSEEEQKPLPTLIATNHSKIDASGAEFTGNLRSTFAMANDNSLIDIAGIKVTTRGNVTTMTGGNNIRIFPEPTGQFAALSTAELRSELQGVISQLLDCQKQFNVEFFEPDRKYPSEEHARTVYKQYSTLYDKKFSRISLSLSSEVLARIISIDASSMSFAAQTGSDVVYHDKLMGLYPFTDAAQFLDVLSRRLASD
jgi:hypothetical protein